MLFLLDKDVRTVKWNGIPLHEASSAIVKEETNGDFYLTVRYPITDSGIYQLIKEDMLIKAPVPVLGAQLFRIKKPIENDDSLDITAYHVSDDIMKRSITPVSVVGQGCAMALSQMVQNAKTGLGDFSFTSDIMDNRTFNTTETETLYSVLMDGKHSIVGTWEGELVRDNFALSIKRSRGADRGVVITTHKNLKSYQRTKNSQGVVTRIHARSTFKPDDAKDEVTLRVTVDSPLINSYPYINEKEYENNNAETAEDLRKWAKAKFTNEGIDKVSDAIEIEAYELDGQVVHLGDTVNLKSRKHSADLYKKAIAYEFNALTEEYISITFDDKPGVGGSGVSSGLSNAADAILGASATAQDVAIQRAVKNANAAFDAEFDKRAEKIYDGIEQAKADAEEYADKLKTEISQEFDTFDKEFQATKKSQDQQIADILAKAQANTNLATDAKNIGNQAKLDATTALAKALQYKNEAISEASRLDTVERQATETKLATAKSQAISEANKLVETAKSLLNGQISGVSTDLNQTKEAIKLLATRATVDALTGRILSAESTLQVQAGEIANRVKTSDFDQAKQRISTSESSIVQIGNRITTEISETVAKIPTEIGSVNLIDNTDYRKGVTDWVEDGVSRSLINNYLKLQLLGTSNQRVYKYKDFNRPLTTGESITVSYIAYSSRNGVGFSASTFDARPENQRVTLSLTPTRFVKTFNLRSSRRLSLYVYGNVGDEVFIKDIQVERGVIASDWGLAPEDFMDEITSVKTIITQTAEGQEQLSTKLTETQGKVTAAETNIRQLVNDVSSKVSQTTFDNLKKIVDSQGTSISQNQSAINLKADKTVTDTLSQAVNQTKADLKITSDAVNTKVSQTDFNVATQRLSNAETTIRTQAGQIEQRLTSTQVESAITEKGYATKTSVSNLIKDASDSFSRSITETKALIPADSANQNLLVVVGSTDSSILLGGETYPKVSTNSGYPNNKTMKEAISVESGSKYTFSKISVSGDSYWRISYLSSNFQYIGRLARQENNFTITIPANASYIWVSYPDNANCKIEKGERATQYTLSTADTATVTAFNIVKDTVDTHKRIIGDGSAISETIQTARGLVSRVAILTDSQNLVYDPTRYSKYQARNTTSKLTLANYAMYSALRINHSALTNDQYNGFKLPLRSSTFAQGEKLSLRTVIGIDALPDSGGQIKFEIKNNGTIVAQFLITPTRTGNNQIFTATTTVRTSTAKIDEYGLDVLINRNGNVNITQISLIRGETPPTSFVDNTSAMQLATETQISQLKDSWSFKSLNSAGDIISQANLTSNQFLFEAAKIRLKGKTLADEIQAIDGKFNTLFVSDGTFGKLDATIIGAQAITGGQIKFDQAFFNNLMANDAYLKQLFAKSAFITQVQSVTMSANQISGGSLTATNNATNFNLNTGDLTFNTRSNIVFNQSGNALKRVRNGSTGFLHFNDSSGGGVFVGLGVTSGNIGVKSQDTGSFSGVRVFRDSNSSDQLELYGDNILMGHAFASSAHGLWVKPTKLSGTIDLIDFLRWCRTEILRLHDVKTTEKNYNYTIWGAF